MTNGLFTAENSELAARLHGDPNEFHYGNNRFDKTIAPGLMQLQGFLALHGWKPGKTLSVQLEKPIIVPNQDVHYDLESCYHEQKTFSRATIIKSQPPEIPDNFKHSYAYRLTQEQIPIESLKDWSSYSAVPLPLVTKIIPATDYKTLERIAAVGASANAFVRRLSDDPKFLPEIFFPQFRENGDYALMIKKHLLYMGNTYDERNIEEFTLGVHPVKTNPKKQKELIATVSETNGLYTLEMHITKVHLDILKRMLKRT